MVISLKIKFVYNAFQIARLVMKNLVLYVIIISFYWKTNVCPNVQIFSILMTKYAKIANLIVKLVMINNVNSAKKIFIYIKINAWINVLMDFSNHNKNVKNALKIVMFVMTQILAQNVKIISLWKILSVRKNVQMGIIKKIWNALNAKISARFVMKKNV